MSETEADRPLDAGGSKRCPYCAETIRSEAIKCRYCGSFVETGSDATTAPWLRPRHGRMLAGVCAGLAERFAVSVTVVRLGFLLGFFVSGGMALLLYVALWIAMPAETDWFPEARAGEGRGPG